MAGTRPPPARPSAAGGKRGAAARRVATQQDETWRPKTCRTGTALQMKGQSHRRPRAEWVQPYEMPTTSKAIEVGIRLVAAGGWAGE